MKYLSKKSEDTLMLGEKIGKRLRGGMILALEGDLGGGKTTFTKGIARGLNIKEAITSPSFTLEKIYKVKGNKEIDNLYHFDFYRIDSPKDVVGLELGEVLGNDGGAVVVEWAEKIETVLPKEKLIIKFEYIDENSRKILLKAYGEKYNKIIKGL